MSNPFVIMPFTALLTFQHDHPMLSVNLGLQAAPNLQSHQHCEPEIDYLALATQGDAISNRGIEAWFDKRAERWQKETAIHSSPGAKYLHKDYMAIIARGIENPTEIIPLILKRLSVRGGDWFFALEQIAGENPAKECDDYQDALTAWNEWAKQHTNQGDVVSTY